jgi:transposase
MDAVCDTCCGIDVHKRSVTACLRRRDGRGRVTAEVRTFATTTAALLALADWLAAAGCTHAAMESTGVYWRPVFNLLEGVVPNLLLVNAQHVKHVPGRKTDVKDAAWLAELLQHGLLRASFVPGSDQRDLRELTRYRKVLVQQRADECNRIQKLLETCNIKLASVATDVLGVSGRVMLAAIADGVDDPARLAELARGRLRAKIPQLAEALRGLVRGHHRWLLRAQLDHIAHLDAAIARLDEEIGRRCEASTRDLERLSQIPGVSRRTAEVLVAEVGTDMSRFPDAGHLASWAGMCPGNHESAGRSPSGRARPGNPWLKAALVEAAWAASHTRGTYLSGLYHRVARRRGKKRASVAVGHAILRAVYYLLSDPGREYLDLGADHYDNLHREQTKRRLIGRLEALGLKVTVEEAAA